MKYNSKFFFSHIFPSFICEESSFVYNYYLTFSSLVFIIYLFRLTKTPEVIGFCYDKIHEIEVTDFQNLFFILLPG